jgi:NodT family efflux transporter outer membrane factor (OMF) lipoprotein
MNRAVHARITLGALLLAALLGGCASREGIAPRAAALAPASVGLNDAARIDWPAEQWWRRYQDAALDALVDRALAGNPTVAIAAARLVRAESVAEFADANRGPQVNGAVDMTRQRYTENGLVPKPLAGTIATSNALLLNASWELDLFGRNRAALDAALGSARAAEADLQTARVLLAAQVVRVWFELGRLTAQRAVTAQSLAQQERMAALVRARTEAGLDSRGTQRTAEAGPPETRRQLAALDERIAQARNALAALTLQPPEALAQAAPALSAAAGMALPDRIPADLLGRRGDIVAARWRIEAAMRERDVAQAQFYPNINLAAFVGFSSLGTSRWFESGSGVFGAGPALRLPIFDAGRLRANLKGRTAEIDAAIQQYNGLVADAVRDVADHVAALKALAAQSTEQASAQRAAEDAHTLAGERHRAGLDNALAVLRAQGAVLAQQAIAVDIRARALDLDAGLARALGGGIPLRAPEAR